MGRGYPPRVEVLVVFLGFEISLFDIFRGNIFASSLTPMVVLCRVQNFRNLIER